MDSITEICGYKDSKGKFHDTIDSAKEANEKYRIEELKLEIKNILDNLVQSFLLPRSISKDKYLSKLPTLNRSYSVYSEFVSYYISEDECRYVHTDTYDFAQSAFKYLARDTENFLRLRDAFVKIGDTIEREEMPEVQQELSDIVTVEPVKVPWWKFWKSTN